MGCSDKWWMLLPEMLQVRLDGALSNLVWWKVSLPVAGGLELDDL